VLVLEKLMRQATTKALGSCTAGAVPGVIARLLQGGLLAAIRGSTTGALQLSAAGKELAALDEELWSSAAAVVDAFEQQQQQQQGLGSEEGAHAGGMSRAELRALLVGGCAGEVGSKASTPAAAAAAAPNTAAAVARQFEAALGLCEVLGVVREVPTASEQEVMLQLVVPLPLQQQLQQQMQAKQQQMRHQQQQQQQKQ
jgi:hypothetical protein